MSDKGSAGMLHCPGEEGSTEATLENLICPNCSTENEIFTDEDQVVCENCKHTIKRD